MSTAVNPKPRGASGSSSTCNDLAGAGPFEIRQLGSSQPKPCRAGSPWLTVDETARVERLDHLMHVRWRDSEESLQIRFGSLRAPSLFEEHTEVDVVIPERPAPDADDPTGWRAAEALIGFIADAPAEMAENPDYYLCGQPKA